MGSRTSLWSWGAWLVGGTGVVLFFRVLVGFVVNVVNYEVLPLSAPTRWLTFVIPTILTATFVGLGVLRRRVESRACRSGGNDDGGSPHPAILRAVWPLALPWGVAILWMSHVPPTFLLFCLAVVGMAWSLDRLGFDVPVEVCRNPLDRVAGGLLVVAIVVCTVWETMAQVHFWRHFLLGYADFGFFTTELEHCLPWKEVGPARFADTRLGYHAVWMFYGLAPFYAVFRSPVFLMVVGPLALNLASIPFYRLAKHRTNSPFVGLLVALSWLALPSITRLPYSNTYGFQSIYLAVPWLAGCFCFAMRGRWRASHLCLAAAMLCEETVCGVALGWGVYLLVFGNRRRAGLTIAAAAVAYLVLCTSVVIPHFAAAGTYTRLQLFGDLAREGVWTRLVRPRVGLYLLVLAVPLAVGLCRRPRLVLATVPTLFLVLLLHQKDYLNIKYWHQSSILPVLFAAAVMGVTAPRRGSRRPAPSRRSPPAVGPPVALLMTVLVFQQWLGMSPFSQSQRIYETAPRLGQPDPRLQVVSFVHATFSPATFSVIATERMAAHFTDYRMVTPAPRASWNTRDTSPRVLIVDRSDRWDKIGMENRYPSFLARATAAGFHRVREMGPVLILTNRPAVLNGAAFRSYDRFAARELAQ